MNILFLITKLAIIWNQWFFAVQTDLVTAKFSPK